MLVEKAWGGVFGWGTRRDQDTVDCDRTCLPLKTQLRHPRARIARNILALCLLPTLTVWGTAAAAPPGSYSRSIRQVDKALARKDYSAATELLQRLQRKYPGNGEVLALLVRDYCGQGKYASARHLYAAISANLRQGELETAVRQCHYRHEFEQAQDALAHHAPERALAIATPLYQAGVNRYRAGLVMASAYTRLGHIEKAVAMYRQLHRQYPKDKEIASETNRLGQIQALHKAKNLLSHDDTHAAIAQVKPIYDNDEATYRSDAGALLAAAYSAEGDTSKALEVYRTLLASNPGNAALSKQYARLQSKALVERANILIKNKRYSKAISLLRSHYDGSKPSYAIGMALATACMRSGNPGKAASVYKALQNAYPADHELPELRLRALVAARRYPEASRIYDKLAPSRKKFITNSLGYEARHLYLYSASVGAQFVKDGNGYPNEQIYELRLKAVTQAGTFVGHLRNEHRFNQSAENYRLDYYYHLSRGWYGHLSYAHSPQHSFLADNDYTLALNKNLGPITLMASFRHLAFTQTSADVYFGGVGFYPAPRLQLITGAYYVPQTSGYSLMAEPVWYLGNGEAYAYITAGQIGEQLNVSGGVKRTSSYGIRLGRRLDITPWFGLSLDAFYEHRSNLYNRTGVSLHLTWRW